MKITMYELLGMIKDGKAPNKIKLRAFELKRTQSSDIHRLYVDNDGMFFPKDYNFYLHEQVEDLREEDWAWHQTLKIQNAREYRSKFLKDFQKEYGTNTYPDYDEIYKRYDKMKSRNEKAVEKLYCWGEALDPIFQKEMLNILKGSDKD